MVKRSGSESQTPEPSNSVRDFGGWVSRSLPSRSCSGGGNEFGVAAQFDLFVVDPNRAEILGQAFVEPSLGGGIVVIQQHHGEVVRNRSPRLFFEQVQHDEVLIVAGEKKSGDANGLGIELARLSFNVSQGRNLIVRLVVLEGEDGQRDRLVEMPFVSREAKTARICSKRRATSRPFLSPASVMTRKWAE